MHVQTLISELAVKALDERILPRTARLDAHYIAAVVTQPVLDSIGDELCAVITPDILRLQARKRESSV